MWLECDSESGKHGIQVRIKLSEMRNIYEIKLKDYEEKFKMLTETEINNHDILDYDIFRIEYMREKCENIVEKYKGKMFYTYLLKECAELFYEGD